MRTRDRVNFHRIIKLGPAIGDWTTIKYHDPFLDEASVTPIKDFGFDSLSPEQLKYSHYLHYRLAERVTKKLSADMNVKVELHSIEATQLTYEHFLSLQREKVVQADLIIDNLGKINLVFEWQLADKIVNRLIGGTSEETNVEQFSEVEIDILQTQIQEIIPFFIQSWKQVFSPQQMVMNFICGDYVMDRRISLREGYVFFTFRFFFGKGDLRKLTVGYPTNVLQRLLQLRNELSDPIKMRAYLNPKTLYMLNKGLRVVLGSTTLKLADLQTLQVGDIIPLDHFVSDPVQVQIGEAEPLFAQPGVKNNRYAVKFMDIQDGFSATTPSLVLEEKEPSYSAPWENPGASSYAMPAYSSSPASMQSPPAPAPRYEPEPDFVSAYTAPSYNPPVESGISANAVVSEFSEIKEIEPQQTFSGPMPMSYADSGTFTNMQYEEPQVVENEYQSPPSMAYNESQTAVSGQDDDFSWDDIDEN